MQQWGVKYWGNYAQVAKWISVRSLLAIASIHKFTSRSIDFVIDFPHADLDVYVVIYISLGMGFDENREEWVLKSKTAFLYSGKQVQIGLIF